MATPRATLDIRALRAFSTCWSSKLSPQAAAKFVLNFNHQGTSASASAGACDSGGVAEITAPTDDLKRAWRAEQIEM
jgi:hypothetical protein